MKRITRTRPALLNEVEINFTLGISGNGLTQKEAEWFVSQSIAYYGWAVQGKIPNPHDIVYPDYVRYHHEDIAYMALAPDRQYRAEPGPSSTARVHRRRSK